MEYRMIISFYHINKYMTFDMDMFKIKCTPVHEMMSHMVAFMEEYMRYHFKIETVHVMSTSSNHGKSNLMHIFPQNFSHHSVEEGYS